MAESGIRLLATGEATDDNYLDGIGDLAPGWSPAITTPTPTTRRPTGGSSRASRRASASRLRPGYFAVAAHDALAATDAALARPAPTRAARRWSTASRA